MESEDMDYMSIVSDSIKEQTVKLCEYYFNNIISQYGIKEVLQRLRDYCEPAFFHNVHVCKRVIMIGIIKNYPEKQITEMGTAGILLDVGYIRIQREYLGKQTSLSETEFEEIKNHPYYSRSIAQEIHQSEIVQKYILDHHKIENGGYPLSEEKYILSTEQSEINAADRYEALLEWRPYRPPMDFLQAVQTMYYMCSSVTEKAALNILLITSIYLQK